MATPTPLQSFLGGVGLAIPVQILLTFNGQPFGISGFLRNATRGRKEALASIVGLLMGGLVVGGIEKVGPEVIAAQVPRVVLSGLLVGVGTSLSNGCTSGHMLCGVSRLSIRSIIATATFFITACLTTRPIYGNALPPSRAADWTIGQHGRTLLVVHGLAVAISGSVYYLTAAAQATKESDQVASAPETRTSLRILTSLITGFQFAVALRLSNLTDPNRVISFLLLPIDSSFDPSLAFLAVGALPLAMLLYRFGRGDEKPRLGGKWAIPTTKQIDMKLVLGAAIFGIGWGLGGICPGPAIVNLGRALSGGSGLYQTVVWLGFVILGDLIVTFIT